MAAKEAGLCLNNGRIEGFNMFTINKKNQGRLGDARRIHKYLRMSGIMSQHREIYMVFALKIKISHVNLSSTMSTHL